MTEGALIGNDVASLYEYAMTKGYVPRFAKRLFKATGDATNLAAAINITYGALVYDHVNREANAHAMLKKEGWDKTGFRVTTTATSGAGSGNPSTKGYGGGDVGTTVGTVLDIRPLELDSGPAFLHTPFNVGLAAAFRAKHDDGLDVQEWKIALCRDIHAQLLNEQILVNAETDAGTASANTTDAKTDGTLGLGLESIDRFISSNAEEDDVGGSYTGWYDIYGESASAVDRDAADADDSNDEPFDAVVCRPDATRGTFGTDLPFQMAGVDKLIDATEDNGADPTSQIFLTKRDTRRAVYDELGAAGRFDLTQVQAKLDMNGLSTTATHDGRDITFTVRAYQGRPFVVDKNVPADGKGRMYLIDQRHMHIKVGFPTLYIDVDNPIILNSFETKSLYLTCEQLYATRMNVHGKLRSIQ